MAITHIEIDTDMLKSDVGEIESGIDNAKKALEALMSELEELNTMWKGKANVAFRMSAKKDHEAMLRMISEVEKLKESMCKAAKEYEKCESEVKSMVDSIRI